MSLLAYIVSQNLAPEPTATQSLGYILGASTKLATSLTDLVWPDAGFNLGHVASEQSFGDARPDLTIFDSDGQHRIFVENKFWAGLTDAQPVQYLAALPDDLPTGLVFIVPEQRIPTVWAELKRRSHSAYEVGGESSSDSVTRLQLGTRTLCITSWWHALRLLEQTSPSEGVRRDVLQLGGLAKFGELVGFPPLRGEELSDVGIASRMINYGDLVEPIVAELKSRRFARKTRLLPQADWYDTGRYFAVFKKTGLWLGVALVPWRKTGISPLWLRVHPPRSKTHDYSNLGEHYYRLEEHFEEVQTGKNAKYLPIRLRTGVERDEVIRDAADQVQRLSERLREMTGRED